MERQPMWIRALRLMLQYFTGSALDLKSPYQNEKRARCQRFGVAARREEGEYPLWIFDRRATQQQRQRSATRRAVFWRADGGVAPRSESAAAILPRRALPAARQKTARPFPIYEMGSKKISKCIRLMLCPIREA